MAKTKKLKLRVWCEAYYDTELEVPENMTLEQAYAYAEEHLDEVPLTNLEYLEDSDNLDPEDLALGKISFAE